MKADIYLKADVLDILFENRNKSYGAYPLRKFYNQRLIKSLGIMLLFTILFVASSFIKNDKALDSIPPEITICVLQEPKVIPNEKPLPQKLKKQTNTTATSKRNVPSQLHVNNLKLVDNPDVLPINDLKEGIPISDLTNSGTADIFIPITTEAKEGSGMIEASVTPKIDKSIPQLSADVMPAYPGGMKELISFLRKNLSNPQDLEDGETVSVKIKFVVGYDGSLKSFDVVQDGGTVFNNEVIRVLKKMPAWLPGKSNGENVSVYYTIPVKFTAE